MSNFEASKIYEQIINDVINESRQDFENSGIDEVTLQDLRNIWRENLSATKVANFSWAPHQIDQSVVPGQQQPPQQQQLSQQQQQQQPQQQSFNPLGGDGTTPGASTGVNVGSGTVIKPEQANKPFEFQVKDDNGDIAKSLQKTLRKEKALASLDSDDINSDLDDSDDDAENSDEDGDDAEGMIILCLYEKVLRVKNKWKCNLKDGIANINGRDYAFSKATGESEW